MSSAEYSVESHKLHCSEIRRINSAVTIGNSRPILDVELTEERFFVGLGGVPGRKYSRLRAELAGEVEAAG